MPVVKVGQMVQYFAGPAQPNFERGEVLAAMVVKVLNAEEGDVNLQVFQPVGCGCFKLHDVPMADGEPLAGSWQHIPE